MKTTTVHFALVVLAVVALAGCSGGEGTKAGGSGAPVTLRIGTDDFRETPAGGQIEELARRVEALSSGKLRLEPVWHAAGDGSDWDQRVARLVVDGGLDMGLIPARAWDTEGVTSLRALNAPFLITSDELLADVVSDPIAGEMLEGLEQAGVVGLALFPEGLRHPFGFETPLLGPGDYDGQTIRAATSATTAALFSALGATVNDDPGGLDSGANAGLESSFHRDEPIGPGTANVTFFPKANALVINHEALAELDEGQREILEQAAQQTRDWAIETTPKDAEAASAYCRKGGVVVLASAADVAALERAAAPVYADLERDPQTKRFISRIRALASDLAAMEAATACDGSAGGTSAGAVRIAGVKAGKRAFPEGVYRIELPFDYLRSKGFTAQQAREYQGIQTFTFERGRWFSETKRNLLNPQPCNGLYTESGRRISLKFDSNVCGATKGETLFSGRWSLEGRTLRFTAVRDGKGRPLPALEGRAWTKLR
jgi:TRAP-type C4-dicarboxylate transport system substrate-binding protein